MKKYNKLNNLLSKCFNTEDKMILNKISEFNKLLLKKQVILSKDPPIYHKYDELTDIKGYINLNVNHLNDKIGDLPVYVVKRLLYNQYLQQGYIDHKIFETSPYASKESGGFNRGESVEGATFWSHAFPQYGFISINEDPRYVAGMIINTIVMDNKNNILVKIVEEKIYHLLKDNCDVFIKLDDFVEYPNNSKNFDKYIFGNTGKELKYLYYIQIKDI